MNSHLSPYPLVFKSRRSTRILFAIFGVIFCLLALLVLLLPLDDAAGWVLAFLLLMLPCGGFGLYFLRSWWLLQQARVVVSEEGVALHLPIFKTGWFFRGEPVQLRWDEICCLDHERYPLIEGGKPIDEYWLHSTQGSFVLTKDMCAQAEEVVGLIAAQKGWASTAVATPVQPLPETVTPEQEEAQLKRNAVATLFILLGLMLGIFLIVFGNTALIRKIDAGMAILGQFFNLLFLVTTVASIFGLWWKARQARIGIRKLKARR